MDRALPTMRDVGDRIGLLNNYFSRTPAFTLDLKNSCIEAGMVVLQLFSFLVRFIRNDMPVQAAQSPGKWRSCLAYAETSRSTYYVLGYSQENGWQPLRDQCVQAVSKMDAVLSQAEQYSKTTRAPPPPSERWRQQRAGSSRFAQQLGESSHAGVVGEGSSQAPMCRSAKHQDTALF